MTNIHFHTKAHDRFLAAHQWIINNWKDHSSILVYLPDPDLLSKFDQLLWTRPATGFLPHCHFDSSLSIHSNIFITDKMNYHDKDIPIMVNLSEDCPAHYQNFSEIHEFVDQKETTLTKARQRYLHYKKVGIIPMTTIVGGVS